MSSVKSLPKAKSSQLRQRILAFVGALILISLLGSTISLYRITEVNRLLDSINRVSVPLGRLLAQMQSDTDVFQRELDRSLGYSHWKDPHWKAHPIPHWIEDVLESEVEHVDKLVGSDSPWTDPESREHWKDWTHSISSELRDLRSGAGKLYTALEQNDMTTASEIYPKWMAGAEQWRRQLAWGANEYDRWVRQTFSLAESRVSQLKTGLESILFVVILLSLFLLWLGERALRPLGELTKLAREITVRGIRKEDKALLPGMGLGRKDEVSQLAIEFHRMATALLEREKMVEQQKSRLQEQNQLLRTMGSLNENILNSIESVLIVTNSEGKITQINPEALRWLELPAEELIGQSLDRFPKLALAVSDSAASLRQVVGSGVAIRIEPRKIGEKFYGGNLMALRQEGGESTGAILVLHDLTAETELQERLREAENLAAIGRMSAQVAHEVRNPLHSIGLEAEVASELALGLGSPALKQSISSILMGVDRLEKITDNYLKLSKLSSGQKAPLDLGLILESVLATYAPVCESQNVAVDWHRQEKSTLRIWGDAELLEQVLGNLLRNALQALDHVSQASRKIVWNLGNTESGKVWLRIEDNGPGISSELKGKLFNPYVTTRAQGTGLGLSFVKKVIEDHGGTIESREISGSGACFDILIPALEVEPRQPPRFNPPPKISKKEEGVLNA